MSSFEKKHLTYETLKEMQAQALRKSNEQQITIQEAISQQELLLLQNEAQIKQHFSTPQNLRLPPYFDIKSDALNNTLEITKQALATLKTQLRILQDDHQKIIDSYGMFKQLSQQELLNHHKYLLHLQKKIDQQAIDMFGSRQVG